MLKSNLIVISNVEPNINLYVVSKEKEFKDTFTRYNKMYV